MLSKVKLPIGDGYIVNAMVDSNKNEVIIECDFLHALNIDIDEIFLNRFEDKSNTLVIPEDQDLNIQEVMFNEIPKIEISKVGKLKLNENDKAPLKKVIENNIR